mmetsp:Transcript_9658/g.27630  ORF Transcript_9658/g.27630 Transcript_9658/m.27630 type:complete len:276 (-) Transcript_9658:664-1491(-)
MPFPAEQRQPRARPGAAAGQPGRWGPAGGAPLLRPVLLPCSPNGPRQLHHSGGHPRPPLHGGMHLTPDAPTPALPGGHQPPHHRHPHSHKRHEDPPSPGPHGRGCLALHPPLQPVGPRPGPRALLPRARPAGTLAWGDRRRRLPLHRLCRHPRPQVPSHEDGPQPAGRGLPAAGGGGGRVHLLGVPHPGGGAAGQAFPRGEQGPGGGAGARYGCHGPAGSRGNSGRDGASRGGGGGGAGLLWVAPKREGLGQGRPGQRGNNGEDGAGDPLRLHPP